MNFSCTTSGRRLITSHPERYEQRDKCVIFHPVPCVLCSSEGLVLNVFVKQFDLVALLADFNAQQIAHREHADPTIAIENR